MRLDVHEVAEELERVASRELMRRFERNVAKARAKDSLRALDLPHRRRRTPHHQRPSPDRPVEELQDERPETVERELRGSCASTDSPSSTTGGRLVDGYRFVHMARKVVGVGSVGTRAWIVLLVGRDDDDPLFLQFKEADNSVHMEPYAGAEPLREPRRARGARPAADAGGQRHLPRMAAGGGNGRPPAGLLRAPALGRKALGRDRVLGCQGLEIYARACGFTLARAHARSEDRIAIAAYLGSGETFDRAMSEFAGLYADQAERDHAALAEAAKSGRITATEGL